ARGWGGRRPVRARGGLWVEKGLVERVVEGMSLAGDHLIDLPEPRSLFQQGSHRAGQIDCETAELEHAARVGSELLHVAHRDEERPRERDREWARAGLELDGAVGVVGPATELTVDRFHRLEARTVLELYTDEAIALRQAIQARNQERIQPTTQ